MSQALTVDQFHRALPPQIRKSVSQEVVDRINSTISCPEEMETFRENLLSYAHVLANGKFKMDNYISAVKYVSYKLMGNTNIAAYTKTFPDKYQRFIDEGVTSKDIASYVTAYNKSKLVNLIYEQTLIPTHVLNADLFQKALNVQADLMQNATSEKVRTDAANSLLNHLKRPETQKVELDIGVKENSAIAALRESTMALVAQQRAAISSGAMSAQDAAHSKIIQGERVD